MSKKNPGKVGNTYSGSNLNDLLNGLSGGQPALEDDPEATFMADPPLDPHQGHRLRLKDKFAQDMSFKPFSDHEALELLLFYAIPRCDTNEIAHDLIHKFGSFTGVLNAPYAELIACKGINDQSAAYIKMLMRLCAKYNLEMQRRILVSNSESLEDYMLYQFSSESDECAKLFLVDKHDKLSPPHEIGRGLEDKSVFDFKRAMNVIVNSSVSYVIIAHNHINSGNSPSDNDVVITRRFRQMIEPIGVTLLDHFVICGNDVISMRASGMMDL